MSQKSHHPALTIAVINHHVWGMPLDCLASLGADRASGDTEFLLVNGSSAKSCEEAVERFPSVQIISAPDGGDRADAKNAALARARGELVLLATADTVAVPGALDRLREFVAAHPPDRLVSAQLLLENGMRRRTRYAFPSLLHEVNLFTWVMRRYHRVWHKGRPPIEGAVRNAAGLHATFLMARREAFGRVGRFSPGYRFAHEDLEFCRRAAKAGLRRQVFLGAHVFKMPPQLYGELPVPVRVAMERSLYRLVSETHCAAYGAMFRALRQAKSLCKFALSLLLNRATFRCSMLLNSEEAVHRAILCMAWRRPDAGLPEDVESHVRWEDV